MEKEKFGSQPPPPPPPPGPYQGYPPYNQSYGAPPPPPGPYQGYPPYNQSFGAQQPPPPPPPPGPYQGYPPQNQAFGSQPPPPGYPAYNAPTNVENYPPNNYNAQPQYQYQGPGVGHVPPPPVVNNPQPQVGCFERNQQNKPQTNAAGAACLIFVSGGMNIAFSVQFLTIIFTTHLRISWFIGAMIGALLSSVLVNIIPKKLTVQIASILVIVGGIILAAARVNPDAIIAGRYLDGIGNGLVFANMLVMAGEITVPAIRGVTASYEQMFFTLGFFVQVVISSSWSIYASFTAIQMQGVLSIIYGLMALGGASFLIIESPVSMLAKGQEEQAIDALRCLQNPKVLTTQTYQQLDEHKRYLAENKELSLVQSLTQGLPALLRLILLRALSAMSLSYFVYLSLFLSAIKGYHTVAGWPYITFAVLRYLGCMIPMFMIDSFGRKKIMLLGCLVSGGMAIGFAGVFVDINYRYSLDETFVFLFILSFFAGLASITSSAYLSEAFPLAVKPHLISAVFMVEMLVHLIICCCDYDEDAAVAYFYILGVGWILFFLLGIFCLPETKQLTLREAQHKFKGFISRGF